MSSTKQSYTRIPNGGFDRSFESHVMGPDKWYDLLNFEPVVGALRQTKPIVQKFALTHLTGESVDSQVRFIDIIRDNNASLRYLILNETNARYVNPSATGTQTLLPCILQINVPNNATATGYCLMSGYNSTDFAADGDNIEVTIDAATTFKWRRNGGAYTTGVAIANGVAVGANGLKLYFNATSGFTIGDTWKWQRYNTIPYSGAISSTANFAYSRCFYNTDAYVGGVGRCVLRVRDGFITSVGYNRVYGKYVGIYQNHLVVAHFGQGVYNGSTGVADPFDAKTSPFVVAWSDLDNPDQFFVTSVNETDQYAMPYNEYPDGINQGITGMGLLGRTWYIYLSDSMSTMDYVGLPKVMQILPAFPVGSIFQSGLVVTKNGHYFIARDNVYFFDGTRPQPIGDPVRKKFFSELVDPTNTRWNWTSGFYDPYNRRVIWRYWTNVGGYYQCREMIYSELYGRWYFRNLPSADSGSSNILTAGRTFNDTERLLYGASGTILGEINAENVSGIITDVAALSPTYTNPYAETNDLFYDDLFFIKENDRIGIDAAWTSGVDGIEVGFQARATLGTAVSLSALSQLWTSSQPGIVLGVPRSAGRVLRFSFKGKGTKPYGVVLNGWGEFVYAKQNER